MAPTTFISKEVTKIINDDKYDFPLNIAMASAWILAHFKGLNLKIVEVKNISSIADYFIIGSTNNTIQASSMSDEIVGQMKHNGINLLSREGGRESDWILLDFGDIIVHVFQDTVRDVFDMEELWKNAPKISIPNEFYESSITVPSDDESNSKSGNDYF